MRCPLTIANQRRVLCIFPAYTPSFGTFSHAYSFIAGVRAFMPPQGLLLIAAYMPESWPVRFIDENIAAATAADLAWADIVLVSGMHIQRPQIHDIAHARRRPARSRCWADLRSPGRPSSIRISIISTSAKSATPPTSSSHAWTPASRRRPRSMVFETKERLPLCRLPGSGLRPHPARPLSARQPAIFQRLSVSLRVLRHSRTVRTAAAPEDAGTAHRRTRRHAGAAVPSDDGLFRR